MQTISTQITKSPIFTQLPFVLKIFSALANILIATHEKIGEEILWRAIKI
ncbi:MAG: hypothetical protein J5497_04305 [Selenomonadaceae bacterium]|nr:hypothetical protein [Selenomonadaceae bacterium]